MSPLFPKSCFRARVPASPGTVCLFAALSWLAAPHDASAAEYRAGGNVRILDTLIDPRSAQDTQPLQISSSGALSAPELGSSSGSASVRVRTGGIHLESVSESQVLEGPGHFYGQAEAGGHFSDEFVILAPGLADGTPVRATLGFGVSGALDGQGSGSADGLSWGTGLNWRAGLRVYARNDGVIWDGEGRLSVDAVNVLSSGDVPGMRLFELDTAIGEVVRLEISAFVQARSGAQARGTGLGPARAISFAGFANTMSWQGIGSLADAGGAPIALFSALSPGSGFDYANAYVAEVPEPAIWALWLSGVAGLLVRRYSRWPASSPLSDSAGR